jgi:hypothetical protein
LALRRKESMPYATRWMKLWGCYAKWNKPVTKKIKIILFHLYEVPRVDKI